MNKSLLTLIVFIVAIGLVITFIVLRQNNTTNHLNNSVAHSTTTPASSKIRYLALGDSYTIGQSVATSSRWPNQLVDRLKSDNNLSVDLVGNPSVTGYTTQDLINTELPLLKQLKPSFVTILIGVNDYVQGIDKVTFQHNLDYIISTVQREIVQPGAILLVTIPDYGKTPTGAQFGSPAVSEVGIKDFNSIIMQAGQQFKVPVANIFLVSQAVASDPSLIANDGLHPSAKEYTAWTEVIYKTIVNSDLLQKLNK